jgi:hypothetical protein
MGYFTRFHAVLDASPQKKAEINLGFFLRHVLSIRARRLGLQKARQHLPWFAAFRS